MFFTERWRELARSGWIITGQETEPAGRLAERSPARVNRLVRQ